MVCKKDVQYLIKWMESYKVIHNSEKNGDKTTNIQQHSKYGRKEYHNIKELTERAELRMATGSVVIVWYYYKNEYSH